MEHEGVRDSGLCDGCFMECRSGDGGNGHDYPCKPSLREWAIEHRDDVGDGKGYVWEEN